MDKLPDNVIKFTTLKTDRSKKKRCSCYDYNRHWPQYVIDTENREITCELCGNVVDPFDAMLMLCRRGDKLEDQVNGLYRQAQEIANYKPWLLRIRDLEKRCREGTMVLSCPHCDEGILFEEMTYWVNKEMELNRRKFKHKKGECNHEQTYTTNDRLCD